MEVITDEMSEKFEECIKKVQRDKLEDDKIRCHIERLRYQLTILLSEVK